MHFKYAAKCYWSLGLLDNCLCRLFCRWRHLEATSSSTIRPLFSHPLFWVSSWVFSSCFSSSSSSDISSERCRRFCLQRTENTIDIEKLESIIIIIINSWFRAPPSTRTMTHDIVKFNYAIPEPATIVSSLDSGTSTFSRNAWRLAYRFADRINVSTLTE